MRPIASQIIRDEHAAVAAVLRSLQPLIAYGPGESPERFFDVLRAMLFYIDEFPERLHHPNESNLLFPKLARVAPELLPLIQKLEREHMDGEHRVRELQHLLLAWELMGEPRRAAFVTAARGYVRFYLDHMHTEETELLPVAEARLDAREWGEIDRAFQAHRDPLAGGPSEPSWNRLFSKIVRAAPEPVGIGSSHDALAPHERPTSWRETHPNRPVDGDQWAGREGGAQ